MTRFTLRALFALALCWPLPALAQDDEEPAPAPSTAPSTAPTRRPGLGGRLPTTTLPPPGSTEPGAPPPPQPGAEGPSQPGTTAPTTGAQPGTQPEPGAPVPVPGGGVRVSPDEQRPNPIGSDGKFNLNYPEINLYSLVKNFSNMFERDFILSDQKELEGKKVHIVSHHMVTKDEAWQTFLAAMETAGYTITTSGNISKVIKAGDAGTTPIDVRTGTPGFGGDAYITQLIQLANVSVNDVNKVVSNLVPPEAKVIAYAPTNTLIITDTANNLRKVYEVLNELDVAAPKSRLEIYAIQFAEASEVLNIIEELYGTAETSGGSGGAATAPASRRTSRTRTPTAAAPEGGGGESVTAGVESKYISKVIDDERTNSIIVLANDQGHEAVVNLLAEIDVDVDPQNRAQIHVVYLEHAKAEEVSAVLSELSQSGGSSQQRRAQPAQGQTPAQQARQAALQRQQGGAAGGSDGEGDGSGAIAAFDSGMRIAADENTNSLVIIANNEDFEVVNTVIRKLDIERKQVFVDAVILELSSEDTFDLGLAAHMPIQPDPNAVGFVGGQFGTQSLGLTQDLLSGLAVGVFGESVTVPVSDPTTGGTMDLAIPAFGIVMNALKTNSSVNIVSNPNILTLDNQEAEIVVGRRVPFPTTGGFSNLGTPITTFQREDVAITLKVTPRVNSSNYVTLEVELEVQEIEEDDGGLSTVATGGPVTSKREEKTTVLIGDNQTVVLGGLVGATDTEVETKFPILGDLPLIGALFRGKRSQSRKTNMMIFLTPHIIDDKYDMFEVQRVKEAQRQEFIRRFYGKSREQYMAEMRALLRYSMNHVDEPSVFRGPTSVRRDFSDGAAPFDDGTLDDLEDEVDGGRGNEPGARALTPPEDELTIELPPGEPTSGTEGG